MILCWFGVLLVTLFVGSALLRASIGLANRTIGRVKQEGIIPYGDWDSDEEDEEFLLLSEGEPAIREPGVFAGMWIVFLTSLAGGLVSFVLSGMLDGPPDEWSLRVAWAVIQVVTGFVVLLLLLTWMLPTQPKWAALAAGYASLIVIALGVFIYGVVVSLFG